MRSQDMTWPRRAVGTSRRATGRTGRSGPDGADASQCEVGPCLRWKKYGRKNTSAVPHAARLRGHYHGPHTQVRHRAAVCTQLARPRVPTSNTTTLSIIGRPGAVRKSACSR